jgi:hypothetical protein
MKLSLVSFSTLFCFTKLTDRLAAIFVLGFGSLISGLALVSPSSAQLIQQPKASDPEQPGKLLKTPKDNTAANQKKLTNALKSKVKYSVVKACQGEFLFLKESTKKSGSPYWQVRLGDGKAKVKDVLVATDARFSLVQNQTQNLSPVVLSEIRNYNSKDLMEMDAKNMICK